MTYTLEYIEPKKQDVEREKTRERVRVEKKKERKKERIVTLNNDIYARIYRTQETRCGERENERDSREREREKRHDITFPGPLELMPQQ